MAFFSKFFSTPERVPLPTLEALLEARGVPLDLPGLEPHKADFQHLRAEERQHWADAVAELMAHGWSLPPLWLDAQYDLAPRLVPAWRAEREGFFFRPYLDGLSLRFEACGQLMPAAWLAIWGVSGEDVRERAIEQLREKSKDVPFLRLPSGLYQGSWPDGQSASRLLLPELWSGLFPGQNTFVALPTEDTLLVCPQVLLPKLVDAINKTLAAGGARLQATIFQQDGVHFLPANLQDPHPIAQPQRELRQADLLEAYRAQEADLPAELGKCAPVGVLKTQQGTSVSFCIWEEGQPVLLPETDLVGFVAASGKPLGIYQRRTLPRIADLKGTLVDIWGPRRIRYQGFPATAMLERLDCFATPEQMAGLFKGGAEQPGAPPRPAPRPRPDQASSGALAAQGSSPVPAHLRGLSLGSQDSE